MNIGFVIVGANAALIGLAILVAAIRGAGGAEDARRTAMLIGGMMLTAFGLLMAGFAVGYHVTEPASAGAAR